MVRRVRTLVVLLLAISSVLFVVNNFVIKLQKSGDLSEGYPHQRREDEDQEAKRQKKREELQQNMRERETLKEGEKKEFIETPDEKPNDLKGKPSGESQREKERKDMLVKQGFWDNEVEDVVRHSVNMSEMETVMAERRDKLKTRCVEMVGAAQRSQPPNSKEFLVSEKYGLVWCNIFKAASSTWLTHYLRMAGVKPQEISTYRNSPVEAARQFYPRPSISDLQRYKGDPHYISFLIVRDPFQRLLSAYRDKIESTQQIFYKSLRCEIQESSYILPDLKDAQQTPVELQPEQVGGVQVCRPSFKKFVEFVLSEEEKGNTQNEHWEPYYRFCTPCQFTFDYILHFETLSEEETFLLEKVPGLSDVLYSERMHSSHTNYAKATPLYFGQLPRALLVALYTFYRTDFEIFGYSVDKYFDFVT